MKAAELKLVGWLTDDYYHFFFHSNFAIIIAVIVILDSVADNNYCRLPLYCINDNLF